nr:tumor necrosis factor receptor superfamily member 16-like [Anolis sagrei ordinatus]
MDLNQALLFLARILLLLGLPGLQVLAHQGCEHGHFTLAGDCCELCPPGFGASVPCGSANTKCEPCQEGVTFSSVFSATEPCWPCSPCPGNVPALEACAPTRDTVCAARCPRGHFQDLQPGANGSRLGGRCVPCQLCPGGYGAAKPCSPSADTTCQKCPPGYYSEVKSAFEPCLPCRRECGPNEVMIQACSPLSDTLCMDKELQILKRTEGDPRKDVPKRNPHLDTEGFGNTSSPGFTAEEEDNSKDIIPVYCSILAAVVVGLLAYVAFKCWTTCKQKHQLAKARAGEAVMSPEGEKLHSDSGVFLDTHSLQEHHPLNKAHRAEPRLFVNLPPHKKEEVERLLEAPNHGKDWRRLADRLGYEDETIEIFGRGEAPAHTLLSDWSSKEGATLEALSAALMAIEREDVVENLNSPAEISSVV